MKRGLKPYLSVFCLLIILLPFIAVQVHAFQFHEDEHCSEAQSTHFHKAKHHCFICDYVPPVSNEPIDVLQLTTLTTFQFVFTVPYTEHFSSTSFFHYTLRGPPTHS